jgi:hypothetical protein
MVAKPTSGVVPRIEVEGQHIFPDDELHQYAVRWKELTAAKKTAEAMVLLEKIVEGSTPMFIRFAQHEKFHHTVDLEILISAAQEKVVNWLLRWEPSLGKLFTWFSKCAKNAFLSELVKVNQYRKRYHSTDDSLEKFIGTEDHAIDKRDLAHEVRGEIEQLTCRWGDPQEIGALRYQIECIVDEDNRDRQGAIRGAAYCWGISMEMSKFFYRWALTALRGAFINRVRVNFTEADLFLLTDTYTDFADFHDIMNFASMKQAMILHGGKRVKIPPISYLIRRKQQLRMWAEIERTSKDPLSIAEVAERHNKSAKTATQSYHEMCEILNPRRSGEYFIFQNNDED